MTKTWMLTGLMATGLAMAMTASGCADEEPIVVVPAQNIELASPPPISGGSLLVMREQARAVIADTDVDQLVVIDLNDMSIAHTVPLQAGDEPGRVIAGPAGSAFVALRRGGAVVALNLESGAINRRAVCPAPRGMAYDPDNNALHVACAGGELVSLSADLNGAPLRQLTIADDLRDVLLVKGNLVVNRFRAADLFVVSPDGSVANAGTPHEFAGTGFTAPFSPAVAWRMLPLPGQRVMMLHQRGLNGEIPTGAPNSGQSYYAGNCISGILHAAVSEFNGTTGQIVSTPETGGIGSIVLPVDAALSPEGDHIAVVGAGNDVLYSTSLERTRTGDRLTEGCFGNALDVEVRVPGEPVAVAYATSSTVYVQTRQPAALRLIELSSGNELDSVAMPGPGRRHWGHALFHKAASATATLACASCHPEGRDDGRVWVFADIGQRRTQTMSGGVMNTLPLHWDGDMTNLYDLMHEVFVNRMGGEEQPQDRIDAMADWMNGVAAVPASQPADGAAALRGEDLFNSAEVGCAACHSGSSLTNNSNVDVGTGKKFQVPSLVGVAHRAPFMHNGCAADLYERFSNESCGGGDLHGKTSHLTASQIDDLVAYLQTL